MRGYSTREVADLLGMPAPVIRRYARAGLLSDTKGDGHRHHFSFQDIVILRTARALHEAGVKQRRISRVLEQLKRDLPTGNSLTALRIVGLGGEVVVQQEEELYSAESGQIHFNFSVADLAGEVAPLMRGAVESARREEELTSDDWFELGIDLEAVSPDDAPAAYLRAVELDPDHADAHINLGRLYHEEVDWDAAEYHYRAALRAQPDHPLAHYNLGTLLEETGKLDEAIDCYLKATVVPDSHYNLANLYELKGDLRLAQHHLDIYKRMMEPR